MNYILITTDNRIMKRPLYQELPYFDQVPLYGIHWIWRALKALHIQFPAI